MQKLRVLIGSVALLIVATIPLLVGLLINDSNNVMRLRDLTGQPGLSLNTSAGWFSSSGTLQIEAPIIAGVQYEDVRIEADLKIMHGPIMWTSQGVRVGLAWIDITPVLQSLQGNRLETPSLLNTLFQADQDTQISLMAGFDGAMHGQLRSESFTHMVDEQAFDFEDLFLSLDITRNGSAEIGLHSESVNISDTLFALNIDDVAMDLHSASLDASPLPGSLSINLGSVQYSGMQNLILSGISIDYLAREQSSADNTPPVLVLEQSVRVEDIESELPLTEFEITTQLDGVDLALVTEYLRNLRNIQVGTLNFDRAQLDAVFLEMLKEPFSQRSQIAATVWGGKHRARLEIIWPGEPTLLTMEQLTFGRVVGLLDADLTINANEQALLQSMFAASVRTYTALGVLPQNNGDVVITASLQGANLILNGQRIQLAPFLNIGYTGTP